MPREYRATVTVQGWQKHTCEHCGERFAYPLRRTVSATAGTGWTGNDEKAVRDAKRAARESAADELASGIEPVPCLHCGRFQTEMVDQMRRKKVRLKTILLFVSGGLTVATGCLAALVTVAMLGVNDKKNTGLPLAIVGVSWAVVLIFVLAAALLLFLRRGTLASFDPYNGKSEQFWKREARELGAVTIEEQKAIEERRRAAEEANVAAQAGLNFEEGAKKPGAPPWAKGAKPAAPSPPPQAAPAPPPAKNPFDFG